MNLIKTVLIGMAALLAMVILPLRTFAWAVRHPFYALCWFRYRLPYSAVYRAAFVLLCALAVLPVHAQTSAPDTNGPPNPITIINDKTNGFLGEIGHAFGDAWAQLKDTSFKDGVNVAPFGLKHNSDWGAGLAFSTGTTNALRLGFALAAIQETTKEAATGKSVTKIKFYDASLSIQANGTMTIPYLGWTVPTYLETGPATDLANPTVLYEQSFAGVREEWDINGNWYFGFNFAAGHCSKWSGDLLYLGGLEFTCRLKGKGLFGLW